jgi:hypothetical protein
VRRVVWCIEYAHQVCLTLPRWLPDMARTFPFSIGASGSSVPAQAVQPELISSARPLKGRASCGKSVQRRS